MKFLPEFCLPAFLALAVLHCGGGGGSNQPKPEFPPPPAPANLVATADATYGRVKLGWSVDYASVDWLTIESRTQGGSFGVFLDHVPPVPSLQTFSLPASFPELSTITFRTCSNAHSLKSPFSNETSYTSGVAPATTIGAAWSSVGIQVTWDHPSAVATGVLLERTVVQNGIQVGWVTLPGIGLGDTTYLDTGITDITSYLYRVTYTKDSHSSGATVMANPVTVPMLVPTDVQAVAQPDGNVQVTWTNHSSRAASLTLLRIRSTQSNDQIGYYTPLVTSQTAFLDTATAPGYYTYALSIFDGYMTYRTSTHAMVYIPGPAGDLTFTHSLHTIPEVGGWYFRADNGQWGFMSNFMNSPSATFGWMTDQGPVTAAYPTSAKSIVSPGPLVDAQGRVHFLGFTPLTPSGGRLDHFLYDGTAWSTEVAATSANYSWDYIQVAGLDAQGHLHVLCPDKDTVTMHYLSDASGSWRDESLALPCPGSGNILNSLAVDPLGGLHISALNGGVVMNRATDGSWTQEAIPLGGASIGRGNLTVAALAGDILVAFFTTGPGTPVMAVSRVGGTWGSPGQLMDWNYGNDRTTQVVTARDGSRLALACFDGRGIAVATTMDGITWKKANIPTSPVYGSSFNMGFTPAGKLWIDVDSDYAGFGSPKTFHMLFEEP